MRIGGITTLLETVGLRMLLVPPLNEDKYDRIDGLLFHTDFDELAYDLGWVMANAIEKKDGKAAIFALLKYVPKRFVLRYQDIARGDEKLPAFGEAFIRAVTALPE